MYRRLVLAQGECGEARVVFRLANYGVVLACPDVQQTERQVLCRSTADSRGVRAGDEVPLVLIFFAAAGSCRCRDGIFFGLLDGAECEAGFLGNRTR